MKHMPLSATRIQQLLRQARSAARRAYCPYSKFRVGAALLTTNGRVFAGCNVENASYGLTLCAERNAVGAAVAAGFRRFSAVAVVGGRAPEPALPCGACLQVLAEFGGHDFQVIAAGLAPGAKPQLLRLRDLLPKAFSFTHK